MQIAEKKRFGLKTLSIILDDDAARAAVHDHRYARISVLSLNKLDLPGFRMIQSKETGLIELHKNLDEIMAGFSSTARNEIRRTMTEDSPYTFRFSPHITREAYDLYLDFEKQLHRVTFPFATFNSCWEIAALKGEAVVSVMWVYDSSPVARVRHIFSIRHTDKTVSYANRRVMYEVVKHCKEQGCTAVDLAGIVPYSQDFKWSFHPTIVRDYAYVRSSLLYRMLERGIMMLRRFQQRNYKRRVIKS